MADTFAYDSDYQALVLAECLRNKQFRDLVKDTVGPEQFANHALQWFYSTITSSSISLTKSSLKEEMIKASSQKKIRKEEVPAYIELYKQVTRPVLPEESEHLKATLNKFVRTQNVKRALLETFDLVKEGRWEEIETIVSDAVASGVDVLSFGHDYFSDYEQRLEDRETRSRAESVSMGIAPCDEIMNGGLKNKQVGMVVGASGRGKSLFLEWLCYVAVLLGKTALYITLELPEESIADRFDSLLSNISPHELRENKADVAKVFDALNHKYNKKLYIKGFSPGTTPVSAFQSYFKNLASQGIVADVVCIDYLDLIKPHKHYDNPNSEMDAICVALSAFAKECNTRIWTASQLNRGGIVQENPDETSIAGAINKIFVVDVAIFMAQTKEEREDEELRLSFIKNRNGLTGKQVRIETDFKHMKFFKSVVADVDRKKKEKAEEEEEPEIDAEMGYGDED